MAALAVSAAYITVSPPDTEHVLTSQIEHHPVVVDPAAHEARLLFVGDLMFDRSVRSYARTTGLEQLFSCAVEDLQSVDGVIGNLEGPITDHASVSEGKKVGEQGNTQFTFAPEVAPLLHDLGFVAVSIGNNHIRDFGPAGIASTRSYLDTAGIAYVGDPKDQKTNSTTLSINGVPVTLIVYNEFFGSPEETITALHEHENETTVVFAHWGNEYQQPSAGQRALAKRFVEAGADIVIGAHPHVIQESEVIDGVPVYYSLGNFIFDQYWSEQVRTGAGVVVTFGPDGIVQTESKLFHLERDRRTCPIAESRAPAHN
jgi:poly-gamma-glutamate synthesis protein (capsule biosynthesis protein)